MTAPILVLVFAVTLYSIGRKLSGRSSNTVLVVVMVAYAVRLLLTLFVREIPLFSHGLGGDWFIYQDQAKIIARLWSNEHIHYVTDSEFPALGLGRTSLPGNLYGLVTYVNGDMSPLACTSIVAFLACLTGLNVFALALEAGARRKIATIVLVTLLFLPSFLFYTSDMYKDGIVNFCVVGVVGSALRLSRRFSFRHLAFAAVCLAALAGTRFYLVYATLAPLLVGLLGLRSGSVLQTVVSAVMLGIVLLGVVGLSGASERLFDDASTTFEQYTSPEARAALAQGGSAVEIEGTGGTAYAKALLYTLFAPFLWQGGSTGLQVAKIDSMVWYCIAYGAIRGAIRLARSRFVEVLVLVSFIVPTTFAYAAAFANIGLTVRERLGVVIISALMAAMGTARASEDAGLTKDLPGNVPGLVKA